jgi:hypothetical protein
VQREDPVNVRQDDPLATGLIMTLRAYVGMIAALVLSAALAFLLWPVDVQLRNTETHSYQAVNCGNGWSMREYRGYVFEGYYRECPNEVAGRRLVAWPAVVVSGVVLGGVLLTRRRATVGAL